MQNPAPRSLRPSDFSPALTPGLVAASALLVASLSGCALRGSGNEAIEVREVDEFHEIELGGAFELTVHVDLDEKQRVEVRGDDNIVPKISTTVSGGELEIELDGPAWVRPKLPMHVDVWVTSLTAIDASGASDITVYGLHGERFELDVSGASDSTLAGAVDTFEIDSSGASKIAARDLQAQVVEIDLSGAGKAEVWASKRLEVDVSGAGTVRYHGKPEQVVKDISGAGKVEPAS